MIEALGWSGNAALAVCGIPLAWSCLQEGNADGVHTPFLALWVTGEYTTLAYVIYLQDWPLLLNFSCNAVALAVILWYKFFPRR